MPQAHLEQPRHDAGPQLRRPRKISSILRARCPACRTGRMFIQPIYKFNGFAKMHEDCPHCGQDFKVEPGFYMSASYIGYVLYVGLILILTFLSFRFFPELNDILLISGIILITLLLIPLNFRFSRAICLHLLGSIRYSPQRMFQENTLFVAGDGELRQGPAGVPDESLPT